MNIKHIIAALQADAVRGAADTDITGVCIDSRKAKAGDLFIAVKGTQTDGHAYIGKALEQGAVAVVHSEKIPDEIAQKATFIHVEDTEAAAGIAATTFYGNPTSRLKLVGVTGTNGKTTIATVLYNLFRGLGYKCGLCSTVCNYIDGEEIPTEHTTPDPVTLNELLSRMADAGCEYAFMECSSHAIQQKRIAGLQFAGGIFTNLTRDHLDYHKTFENYRDAKKAFFDGLAKDAFAITNADDRNGSVMVQNCNAAIRTYSTRTAADFKGRILEESLEGMLLDMDGREVSVHFVGRFNVSNLLAVYAAAVMLGEERDEVLRVLSTLRPVNGRFEAIRSPQGFSAIVDYAHTPDALENVLVAIGEIVHGKGRVITVCGAGGNRDKGKRPLMAQEAAKRSDLVIITSDNPRFEEPQAIVDDMLAGLDEAQLKNTLAIVDRREAIRTAARLAQKGDVILVAGKGHEPYQEVKGVKHHFDDHEEIRKAFGIE
ncbi:MAG: UDP-N-acetylmuramoyl-L-alanyl-D-glutamate--2,6-diaminopimelate ligase [Alloprevotella sp.]|nr:UDP-N-acetylmuramoyl-L-alanyl-D-glutamate--2,6-diaminopimelate ligase [Alloprevotella sp.]MBR1595034.1 UDP-N-acetylmuramoyl-L-alanyl-D-glutamate--2,6-diaminopimelate ligase [Alloprevotella sp.]